MADNQNERIREIITEAAQVQLASLNAGIVFWQNWVDIASEYAQVVNKELVEATKDDSDTAESIARITESSQKILREMTELPSLAVQEFNDELEQFRAGTKKSRPKRQAKTKL